ncbi:MAG TPA: 16S rRNA (cytosine(967)-C(5))-methyltransferase RsmB, partial [Steroidobacteraceae bacterium]|nr:16S rRNA (cytosine(967)-C(5))-methyltransferase RsmB [Steroidobacteraceae bacterium]
MTSRPDRSARAGRPAPGTAATVLSGAAGVVAAVLAEGTNAEEALARQAHEPQRAAIHAVALGTVRWYLRLAPAVLPMLARSEAQTDARLRALLVSAVHQFEYSAHAPATTVAAAVDAARLLGLDRAAGLTNAILRRYLRERAARLALVDRDLAARTAHPDWLVAQLRAAWPEALEAMLRANNEHPPLCLRVDTGRVGMAQYLEELTAAGLHGERVAMIDTAVTLNTAPPLSEVPGFAAGRVSVQDSSAQLAAQLLEPRPGEHLLDACAAPGGKTGALLELAGGAIELTALDSDAPRLGRVADNLKRLGREARLVHAELGAAPSWWDGRMFDAILLDAPCSGTGVIRRHPDIKLLRRAGDIAGFAARQLGLLRACWPLLRPGGRLLYVTCSILPAENSNVVAAFVAGQPGVTERKLPGAEARAPLLRRCPYGWQLLPGAGGDGFYYACL